VVLSFLAIGSVLKRFTKPVNLLMGAVAQLSARNYAQPVPAARYPDELGSFNGAGKPSRRRPRGGAAGTQASTAREKEFAARP